MPRPKKNRHICAMPELVTFGPWNHSKAQKTPIIMTIDEYETIRLIDLEGYNQIDCAKQMQVARTTAQKIYNEGKRKLADALINGKIIHIEGGEFELCSYEKDGRFCHGCGRNRMKERNNS